MTIVSRNHRKIILTGLLAVSFLCIWLDQSAQAQFGDNNYVATPDSIVTHLAGQILAAGGNAIDAGVAAMFALTIVEPFSSGLGGGGLMIIRMNKSHPPVVIDFRETAPINIDPALFYSSNENFDFYSSSGIMSICVPGLVAGAEKALQLYGSKSLAQVLATVIKMAATELPVSQSLSYLISRNYDRLEISRITSEIFSPDWLPLRVGELQKREDLLAAFEELSQHGADSFYRGKIADAIVQLMDENNGMLRLPDLASYETIMKAPLKLNFHEFEILSAGEPAIGGIILLEMLKILEQCDFTKIVPGSGSFIHHFIEAQKSAVQRCADKLYRQSANSATESQPPTTVYSKWEQITDSSQAKPYTGRFLDFKESRNAAAITVYDQQGNVISIVQTLNFFFGSGMTVENYGVLFNNALNAFSWNASSPNALQPGKRPWTYLCPLIVLKNNVPFLVAGSSGGSYSSAVLAQILIYITEYGLTLDEAILLPRFSYNFIQDAIEMESRVEAEAIDFLKKRGHQIRLSSKYDTVFGNVQAVIFDEISRKPIARSDVRKEGVIYLPK